MQFHPLQRQLCNQGLEFIRQQKEKMQRSIRKESNKGPSYKFRRHAKLSVMSIQFDYSTCYSETDLLVRLNVKNSIVKMFSPRKVTDSMELPQCLSLNSEQTSPDESSSRNTSEQNEKGIQPEKQPELEPYLQKCDHSKCFSDSILTDSFELKRFKPLLQDDIAKQTISPDGWAFLADNTSDFSDSPKSIEGKLPEKQPELEPYPQKCDHLKCFSDSILTDNLELKRFKPLLKDDIAKQTILPDEWAFPADNASDFSDSPKSIEGWPKVKKTKFMVKMKTVLDPEASQIPTRLLIHIVFLIVSTMYILSDHTKPKYYLNKAIKDTFINTPGNFHGYSKMTFHDIKEDEEVWSFLSTTFLEGLIKYSHRDLLVREDNHLATLPRVRSVAVAADTCVIPEEYENYFYECFGYYTEENEMKSGAETKNGTYESSKKNGGKVYTGKIATYRSSGFLKDLTSNKAMNMKLLSAMEKDGWFAADVRAMFVDVAFFNSNTNLFAILRLVFEKATTGFIETTYHLDIVDLHKNLEATDIGYRLLKDAFTMFIIFTAVDIIYWFYCEGLQHLITLSALNNLLIIGLSIAFLVLHMKMIRLAEQTLGVQDWDVETFHSFEDIVHLNRTIKNIKAFLLFFSWIKTFQYLWFTHTMAILVISMKENKKAIRGCCILIAGILLRFSIWAHLIFGFYVQGYESYGQTVMSLAKALVGHFKCHIFFDAPVDVIYIFSFIFCFILAILTFGTYVLSAVFVVAYARTSKHIKRPNFWMLSIWLRNLFFSKTKICYTSAFRRAGFDSTTISYLLGKYNISACEEMRPEILKQIIREEKADIWKSDHEVFAAQHEIMELERHIHGIQDYIQFTVAKLEEYIWKVEIILESWAELLKKKNRSK